MKRPSPLSVSAVLAGVLALSLAPGTLAQPCPETCIETPSPARHCSSNPTGIWSGNTADGTGTGSYDLALGKAQAQSAYFAWATVDAADEYVITGPPDGTPVAITARLVLSGTMNRQCQYFGDYLLGCAGAGLSITVVDSASSSLSYESPASNIGLTSVSHTLELPLTKNAGQPFRLGWSVHAGSSQQSDLNIHGSANGTATLSFQVPPGVTISSCSGYVGDVVSARPGSWGALKLRYR